MWVTPTARRKIYAYRMEQKSRDSSKDFTTPLSGCGNARTWRDLVRRHHHVGVRLDVDDKIYSYNMPAQSADATLSDITVSPKDIIGFDADRESYEVGVASTVAQATVSATVNEEYAEVVITPPTP